MCMPNTLTKGYNRSLFSLSFFIPIFFGTTFFPFVRSVELVVDLSENEKHLFLFTFHNRRRRLLLPYVWFVAALSNEKLNRRSQIHRCKRSLCPLPLNKFPNCSSHIVRAVRVSFVLFRFVVWSSRLHGIQLSILLLHVMICCNQNGKCFNWNNYEFTNDWRSRSRSTHSK